MKPGRDFIGIGVGAVIRDAEDRFLLLYHSEQCRTNHNTWAVPGGLVEYGEPRTEALKREMREELGCEIEIEQELYTVESVNVSGECWVTTHFLCRTLSAPQNLEPQKHPEMGWFTREEARTLPLAGYMSQVLPRLEQLFYS